MNDTKNGGTEAALLAAVVAWLLGVKITQSASKQSARLALEGAPNGWAQRPQTALGEILAARDTQNWQRTATRGHQPPTSLILAHYATDRAIIASNGAAPYFPYFLTASILGLVALRFLWRIVSDGGVSMAGYLLTGAGYAALGLGLAASVPSAGPAGSQRLVLGFGILELLGGVVLLIIGAGKKADARKLKYGPPFVLPRTASGNVSRPPDGIVVGRAEKDVLPKHTAWSAGAAGDVVIPFDRLSCGVTILGEKGSGKSRLLFGFHDAIRQRYPKTPLLIHDPKGEWYRTYFDPKTDLVFAPHFHGSTHWSIWSDFAEIPELCHELIATAVYAHDTKGDTFWMDSAVRLLRSIAHEKSLELGMAKLTRMKQRNAVDKTWLSIYQVAQLGLEDIIKVELPPPGTQGQVMSIDDYLEWPGRIFLLNDPSCATEQKGAFSLFLSAFMLRALSKPDLPAGGLRAAAIVDEALTFNLPPDVDRRIYALCRSKGLSVIAGAQRLPVHHLHERGEWPTAEFLFGMKVISQDTQSSLARRAGQMHFDQARTGRSLSNGRVSISENDQAERIDAVPPEHFGRLAPRQFVLYHDGGLVTGRTASVEHAQRELAMPKYDSREDVYEFTQTLQGVPKASDPGIRKREHAQAPERPELGGHDE